MKLKTQNSLLFNSVNLANLREDAKSNSVYIFILYGK